MKWWTSITTRQIVSGDVENLSYIDGIGRIVVTSRTRAYVGEQTARRPGSRVSTHDAQWGR